MEGAALVPLCALTTAVTRMASWDGRGGPADKTGAMTPLLNKEP